MTHIDTFTANAAPVMAAIADIRDTVRARRCPARPAMDHHEGSDAYTREVARAGRYRVALCKDGIQWLIQRSRIVRGETRWDAVRFCITRKALHRDWLSLTGEPIPSELINLPERAPVSPSKEPLGGWREAA